MMKRLFLSLVCLACLGSVSAHAADDKDKKIPARILAGQQRLEDKMNGLYAQAVDDLYANPQYAKEKIIIARSYYPYAALFRMESSKIIDSMTRHAYNYEKATEPKEKYTELNAYNTLVRSYISDFDVASMALTLSLNNPSLGNPSFFEAVRAGLDAAMMRPEFDGKKAETAYVPITVGEERRILSRLGVKVLKNDVFEITGKVYDVYDVKSLKTGKESRIFVDVSIPVTQTKRRFEREQQKQEKTVPKL